MPIYEFECIDCHYRVEKLLLAFTHDAVEVEPPLCEKCNGKMAPIISKSSFRLIPGGSGGFYSPSKG